MGWCGATSIYLAAEGFQDIYKLTSKGVNVGYNAWLQAFTDLITALEEGDWDCQDDAMDSLTKGDIMYTALVNAIGYPDCNGRCYEIRCGGDGECGCECHYV